MKDLGLGFYTLKGLLGIRKTGKIRNVRANICGFVDEVLVKLSFQKERLLNVYQNNA